MFAHVNWPVAHVFAIFFCGHGNFAYKMSRVLARRSATSRKESLLRNELPLHSRPRARICMGQTANELTVAEELSVLQAAVDDPVVEQV